MRHSVKVLIVDDDEYIVYFLSRFLEEEGYKIKTAYNGQVGLDILCKEKFEIVLLDIKMPGFDGLDTMKEIKSLKPEPVVIVFTGERDHDRETEVIHEGAFGVIYKPYDINKLRKMVKRAVIEYEKRKR